MNTSPVAPYQSILGVPTRCDVCSGFIARREGEVLDQYTFTRHRRFEIFCGTCRKVFIAGSEVEDASVKAT